MYIFASVTNQLIVHMLTEEQIREIKELIQKKIHDLDSKIEEYKELTRPIAPDSAIGRVSRMDAINNRSVNQAALRKAEEQKRDLLSALKNIDKDFFGLCTKCGGNIPIGRILLMPGKTRCVRCAG